MPFHSQTLSVAEFAAAFPFYFAFDAACRLTEFGDKLPRICSRVRVGSLIADCFEISRPAVACDYESIIANRQKLFLIHCRGSRALLRGQMLPRSGGEVLFLGSIWLSNPQELSRYGLGAMDFPIHDPSMDVLFALQSQATAMGELRETAGELSRQRAELRQANEELQAKNQELEKAVVLRQKMEARLHLLGLVAALTDHGVVITDEKGKVVWVNNGFTKLTGYTLGEAQGKSPGALLQGLGTDDASVRYMRNQIRDGKPFKCDVLNYSKQGKGYWATIEAVPVRNEEGAIINYLAIQTDITEQMLTESLLRHEKELMRATLYSVTDGVILTDSMGKIKLINPVAARLVGWEQDRAEGKALDAVMVLRDRSGVRVDSPCHEAMNCGQPVGNLNSMETVLQLETDGERPFNVVVAAIPVQPSAADFAGCLVILRDVSVALEVQQMQEDFIHAVSHELHTPLTSISGFVATMLREPQLELELRQEFLQIMQNQTVRLRRLVDDILQVARMEEGRESYVQEQLDLCEVVEASLHEVHAKAEGRSVRIEWNPQIRPVTFHGDPLRLQSLVTNLLTNAIKFSSQGQVVFVGLGDEGNAVQLVVRDEGLGIPKEEQERIFTKFYRVNRPDRQIPGTGLGLTIAKRVVEHYRGKIQLTSEPGLGSCFTVVLPREKVASES